MYALAPGYSFSTATPRTEKPARLTPTTERKDQRMISPQTGFYLAKARYTLAISGIPSIGGDGRFADEAR
jgi:hypothetical protein